MKRGILPLLWLLSILIMPPRPIYAAEPEQKPAPTEQKPAEPADKPLEPGWLSLDSTVGAADGWLAVNKAAVEGAIGIGVATVLQTPVTLGVHVIRRIRPESAVDIFMGTKTQLTGMIFIWYWINRKRIGAWDSTYQVISAGLASC